MYTVIVGAGSQIAFEYIKLSEQKKYILIDLPSKIHTLELQYASFSNDKDLILQGLDIRDIKKIEETFRRLLNYKFSEVVILAGINSLTDALDTREELWDNILDTNLKGCFFIMCEAAKNMINHNVAGSIVNIASQHAFVGNYYRAAYCASKAALLNLNRVLALEWAEFGIRVNSVCPTWILNDQNKSILLNKNSIRKYLNNIPLRQYCEAKDIAYALEYLLSEKSRMITGQSIIVDGGWIIK